MFDDLKNRFDFFVRNRIRVSRKSFVENEPQLIERNKQENLYTKDILERFFEKIGKEKVCILDIGSKNWFYAKGEYEYFNSFCEEFYLDGVELDANRLYSNFYSRFEVAKFYTKNLINTNYIVGNLIDIKQKYDYIIWILPFVTPEPHLMWGLPKKYFYPSVLLKHAYDLLFPGGQMIIINQGKSEQDVQKELLDNAGIAYKNLGKIESKFFQYKNERYGFLIKK